MSEKSFGVKQLNILGSSGTPPQIESPENLRIRVGIGSTVIIGDSDGSFNSPAPSSVDPNNTAVLNVGIVTANEYYGTFKGDIDPGTSTLSIASSLTDVLGVNANQIYPKIASEDSILFWDSTATKTTYLKIGDGVTIDGDTLKGDYSLPVTGTSGTSGEATWTLTPSSGTGDPVTLKAGTNISIDADNVGSGEFTLNVASGAGITFQSIDVKQYSDNLSPTRTERTCIDPIVVHVDNNIATIGIGSTSNAYGEKYVQDTEPETSCDGDIWYDTTPPAGGANSGITVANQNVNLATLATKLDFVGAGVTATGTGATKTITIDGGVSGTSRIASVKDVKGNTDPGGQITANTWTTRDLNTIADPSNIGISVSSDSSGTGNYMTVPAGTYKITWKAPGWRLYTFQTKLEYSTDSTFATGVTKVIGSSEYASSTDGANTSQTSSEGILASVTFTQETYVRIRQWAAVTGPTSPNNGLGVASYNDVTNDSSGESSIYTTVQIEDLATAVKNVGGDYVAGNTKVAVVKDQKNKGVQGGNFVLGDWRDRDLTVKDDPFSFVTLYPTVRSDGADPQTQPSQTGASSPPSGAKPGYFSLPAGKYKITFSAVAHDVGKNTAAMIWDVNESVINKIYDFTTDASQLDGHFYGTSMACDGASTLSKGSEVVEISETSFFKVIHFCKSTNSASGFGQATDIGDVDKETYLIIEIEDLATAVKEGTDGSVINVKDYGAVGDGSTDDTTAIQACFDAVDAMATGANIVFPTGTYKVTDMLKLPFPGYISLIGSGAKIMSYVTEGAAGYGKPTLAYQGSSDTASVVIDGLSFDGTNVGTNGDCIWANPKGTGFIIKNCVFKKFRHHFVHHDPYSPTSTPQGANTHILESEFRQATDSSVIWTRLDAGTIRNCLFKSNEGIGIEIGQTTSIPLDLNNFNLSNNYFGGYNFTTGAAIAGKYESGQSSGMVIDGCLIEDNLRGGIRTYSGRSIIVNADFEVNGAVRAKLYSGGLTGTFAPGDNLSPGGTVLAWNSNSRNLVIARTGEFDIDETITNTTQSGSGTIQELAPYYWQCDFTGNGREGGGFNCTLGRATRFTGKVPHIITSGSTLLQCDIKETYPLSAPGVINTLRGTIVDARQVSWGDAHNRYGQGDVYAPNYPAAGNVYCGGIMVDDPVTLSFTNLTVPDDQDGINFGPIFFLKDYMVAFLGGSITDQGITEISATGRFFVRNVTDSSRLGDAWTPSTATNTWTPTEKSSLETITAVAYYDKGKDPGYQDTDQYTFGIRSPVGTQNNLTGFVQVVICFTQTP